jgi:hypothetical protein
MSVKHITLTPAHAEKGPNESGKSLAFYQIMGTDGHIYDSMIGADDETHATKIVQHCADRLRSSGEIQLVKARFAFLDDEMPDGHEPWVAVDISVHTPIVGRHLNRKTGDN